LTDNRPAAAPEPRALTDPAPAWRRIETLDILRGFALLGMILVHFHQRTRDPSASFPGLEGWIGWFIWMGLEQKAHGIFALLFGAGFGILLARARARNAPFVAFYLRRLLALALFGAAAQALFGFQILVWYAIAGLWLLLLANWSTRALLAAALIAAAAGPMYMFTRDTIHLRMGGPATIAAAAQARRAQAAAMAGPWRDAAASGSYTRIVRARIDQMRAQYLRPDAVIPDANLSLFILGLLAIRHGVFADPRRHARLISACAVFGLASWASFWWLLPLLPEDYRVGGVQLPVRWGLGVVSDQWLAFSYAGAIVLLLAWWPAWTRRLAPLALSGRMALTNYFIQIAVVDLIAASYGFGIRLRPFARVAATAGLFAAQASISAIWLSRFRYGPLEWVWRCLSYVRLEPLRRSADHGNTPSST